MKETVNRRHFLGATAATGLALSSANVSAIARSSANEKVVVGVMGTGGRGTQLGKVFASQPNVEVKFLCDVDSDRAESARATVAKAAPNATVKPEATGDFRRILDDRDVDVLVVATCNHWHAPGAILGCSAGKHVYVEKPCSHNPREGELLVEAARKNKRLVQMGNQRRSWPKIQEAIELVRGGEIGRAYLAQTWYLNNRASIGKGVEKAPPTNLDYELWQGPAPRKPFHDNYLHYNWHWFWHWGNGELGNNGVHMIDVCRWGLGVDLPARVTSSGGRYRFQDDQETPDTHLVTFDYTDQKSIVWQGWSCNNMPKSSVPEIVFIGEKGSLSIDDTGYAIQDPKGKEIRKSGPGEGGEATHIQNFLAGVRDGTQLNSEIVGAAASTLHCHLGNIAHRVGRSLQCNPKNGHVLNDAQAMTYWSREYDSRWTPKV